jgi:hypothetical protein
MTQDTPVHITLCAICGEVIHYVAGQWVHKPGGERDHEPTRQGSK